MRPLGLLWATCLAVLTFASPLPAQDAKDAPKPPEHTLSLTVTDKATGETVGDADVQVRLDGAQQRSKTDEFGRAAVGLSTKTPNSVTITVKKAGYASLGVRWQGITADKPLPSELQFDLEPGTTIGGVVKDEAGQPVAGATVRVSNSFGEQSGKVSPVVDVDTKTDAQGKWSAAGIAPKIEQMWQNVGAAGFFNDQVHHFVPSVPDVYQKTAVFTITRSSSVTGKVFDPDGKPVAGAAIASGEEGWSGARHKAKSGADGTFTLKDLKAGPVTFTVLGKGLAPERVSAVAPGQALVEVRLNKGTTLALHITDVQGKPLQGVQVSVESWKGINFLEYRFQSDADGNAVWDGAPADGLQLNFSKRGLGDIRRRPVTPSTQPVQITMRPPPKIEGTVVDAATGKPVEQFTIIQGIAWDAASQSITWMDERYGNETAPKAGSGGKFNFTLVNSYPYVAVRVEAAGYMPADSKLFKPEDGDQKFEFKLEKGVPITGTVLSPSKEPVKGADVYLVPPGRPFWVSNGKPNQPGRNATSARTDETGKFSLPPQRDAFALVVLTDDGFARTDIGEAGTTRPSTYDMLLVPWARIEGTINIGSNPGAGEELSVQQRDERGWDPKRPQVGLTNSATADAQGKFKFDRVAPGTVTVYRALHLSENSTNFSHGVRADAKGGATTTVDIGGTGRPLTGRLELPATFTPGSWLAWSPMIRPHVEPPVPPEMPAAVKTGSDEDKQKWLQEFAKTDAGKAFIEKGRRAAEKQNQSHYAFTVKPDGTFRVDDVPAGAYQVHAQFYPADVMRTNSWGNPLATVQYSFNVPEMPGGRSDEPLDLGTIAVKANDKRAAAQ
jgi:protocatechuate 3,4-dioxygenase beta subunit